jgi:hypothetical protein
VVLLLKHSADTEARNKKGKSALDYAQEYSKTDIVALINQQRETRAIWTVIGPLLKCMQIHSGPKPPRTSFPSSSSSSSAFFLSPAVFSQSIDALLPTIRSYAGFGDIPSDYESGSAACVSFLSCAYARAVIEGDTSLSQSSPSSSLA